MQLSNSASWASYEEWEYFSIDLVKSPAKYDVALPRLADSSKVRDKKA